MRRSCSSCRWRCSESSPSTFRTTPARCKRVTRRSPDDRRGSVRLLLGRFHHRWLSIIAGLGRCQGSVPQHQFGTDVASCGRRGRMSTARAIRRRGCDCLPDTLPGPRIGHGTSRSGPLIRSLFLSPWSRAGSASEVRGSLIVSRAAWSLMAILRILCGPACDLIGNRLVCGSI